MNVRPPFWLSLSVAGSAIFLVGAVDTPFPSLGQAPRPFVGQDLAIPESRIIAPSRSRPLVIERADDGMFHLDARVNGVEMRFLIDTGTTAVVMSPRDAARAGLPPGRAAHLLTAGGAAPVRWSRAERIALARREFRDVEIAVLETPFGYSLLGLEALSRLGTITLDGDRMTVD